MLIQLVIGLFSDAIFIFLDVKINSWYDWQNKSSLEKCYTKRLTYTFYKDWKRISKQSLNFSLSLMKNMNRFLLTGTLSGYFLLIFSPSVFLFSKGCSSLYWNFIINYEITKNFRKISIKLLLLAFKLTVKWIITICQYSSCLSCKFEKQNNRCESERGYRLLKLATTSTLILIKIHFKW